MGNMSYCRFRNTYHDLEECLEALQDEGGVKGIEEEADQYEYSYIKKLIKLCKHIVVNFDERKAYDPAFSTQWIAVKDELPPIELDVIVWDGFASYISNRLDEHFVVWDESRNFLDDVTHWQYLPKSPDEI